MSVARLRITLRTSIALDALLFAKLPLLRTSVGFCSGSIFGYRPAVGFFGSRFEHVHLWPPTIDDRLRQRRGTGVWCCDCENRFPSAANRPAAKHRALRMLATTNYTAYACERGSCSDCFVTRGRVLGAKPPTVLLRPRLVAFPRNDRSAFAVEMLGCGCTARSV